MVGDGKKEDDGGSNSEKKMLAPYALTSNDNPVNIITQVQLKGENYDEWARVVRIALRAKKKYGFVDESIKQPDNDSPEPKDWWTINSMLVSWEFNTIEPTLRSTISYMENVKELWEEIKQRFSIRNGPRVQQLKLIVVFNILVIQNGGMTGHAQPQVGLVVGVVVGVDVVFSRVQVEDEDVEELLEPMQFKRHKLMVGEVL
ncbi:hypothetical protein VitviT2T_023410 [Vitis vinifera]|uniref:Retrotransposon Copia-like N-terminal domain-containing protein n=1 Tax=Vitis vinifera TaxID=29760 RepID=A0ABY9DDM7_VITVI|nr:hypothetical protein VitviT2T_023410 [Vitis vinifera]